MKWWGGWTLTLRTLIVIQILSLLFSPEPTFMPSTETSQFKINNDLQHCESQWLVLDFHLIWPFGSTRHSCSLASTWNSFFTWPPEHLTLFPLSAFLPAVASHPTSWALPYLCKCPEVHSMLSSPPYYHLLSRSAVLKYFGLRTPLHL